MAISEASSEFRQVDSVKFEELVISLELMKKSFGQSYINKPRT